MHAEDLRIRPQRRAAGAGGVLVETTPESAGWEYLSFAVRHLPAAGSWASETGAQEAALVLLQGRITVRVGANTIWEMGQRASPFVGLPWAGYLPPRTPFEVQATEPSQVAWAQAPAEGRFPPRLIPPASVVVEDRGGGNMSRTIHHIMPADFPAERLIVVEVWTPAGHWSSYPPHKHDVENLPHENRLEETYYYRMDPPQGFALQRIYSPVDGWDVGVVCEDGDLVLVPRGYHPVSASVGYRCYYLNAQAGPSHAWLIQDDPAHAWVKRTPAQGLVTAPDQPVQ